MLFPITPRVKFAKAPLTEVSCQLSFPPILRIDAHPPVDFQDAIRATFPFYTQDQALPLSPAKGLALPKPGQTITFNLSTAIPSQGKSHVFSTDDGKLFYRLWNNKLMFTCRRYEGWEIFWDHVKNGVVALEQFYMPSFYSHVCLRYKNVIVKSMLGVSECRWSELLIPAALGVLATEPVADAVDKYEHKFTLRLPDKAGLVEASVGLGTNPNTPERAIILESHVYTNSPTKSVDVDAKLNSYHRAAGLFFRWCITDRLRAALEPTELAG